MKIETKGSQLNKIPPGTRVRMLSELVVEAETPEELNIFGEELHKATGDLIRQFKCARKRPSSLNPTEPPRQT